MTGLRFFSLFILLLQAPAAFAVIYGNDDRQEATRDERSRAVGMILNAAIEHVDTYPDPVVTASGLRFKTQVKIAAHDLRRFIEQPRVGDCTSFLVSRDTMITAGHCIESQKECDQTQVVFDYFKPATAAKSLLIPKSEIYRCKKLVAREYQSSNHEPHDYAVIQLDRPVLNRKPLTLSTVSIDSFARKNVEILGFPRGVFMKYADHAQVLQIESPYSFRTNLDSFQVNSGSPIFDRQTGDVIGILISGSFDDNAAMIDGHYSQIDARYAEFPKPGDRQITLDPLLGEQGFYIGEVVHRLKEAGYEL